MALVRWWPFNGDTNDYTTTGQHLKSVSGVTIDNNGKVGKCAYFNGAGQGYTPNPLLGRNVFSICFWAKPNGAGAWSDIFTVETSKFRLEKSDTEKYHFYIDSGQTGPIATDVTAISSLPNAVWTHIAMVFDGSKYTTYKNGVVDTTGTLNSNLVNGANFYIGSRVGGSYWKGYLNDFRIYDHALSVKEVKEIAKAKMIHYTCNPSTNADKYRDSSGFGNHAIATNHPTFSRDDSAMGISSYLFSNGSKKSNGEYQYFKSENTIRVPESGTLSYYLKEQGTRNTDNKYAVGFSQFSSINGLDATSSDNPSVGMIYYHDASSYTIKVSTSTKIRDGNWHMYTLSWTANGTLKVYVDGTLIESHTIGAMYHVGTFRPFIVGSAWDAAYGGYTGYIDDVRLYATQLSDTDVLELYQTKASVSKNGKLFANEICETNFVTKEAYSAKWARIFYHNNKSGTVLFSSDKNEFLHCHTTDKISDLWALERFRGPDGKFELLLEYENISGYNRWKQTSDFTKTTSIIGYEGINISWTGNNWGGLALSQDSSSTWVDGSPNSGGGNWWYAIGCKAKHEGSIPGPAAVTPYPFSLWVRTDNVAGVKVTKKGIVYANEINEVDNTSMKTKTELNANWVRLFYHNNVGGTVLFSNDKNEFLKCNDGGNKISDLWALDQFRGKDGKFEFLLQYQSGGTSYNRWKQSSNFTKEAIADYEAVQVSWTSNYWGGLEYDGTGNTWVTGSVNHSNWYYAIGAKSKYIEGIPSFQEYEDGWVEIWVRCDDINLFRMIKGGKCKATEFIEN